VQEIKSLSYRDRGEFHGHCQDKARLHRVYVQVPVGQAPLVLSGDGVEVRGVHREVAEVASTAGVMDINGRRGAELP